MQLSMFFALTSVRCFASVATDSHNPKGLSTIFLHFPKKIFDFFRSPFSALFRPFLTQKNLSEM